MANQLENLLRLNRSPEMPRGSNRLAGVVEPVMTAGSNILAEIPAYAAGMTELNQTGLPSEGLRRFEEVSEMLTYSPRTMEGQAGLQSLTNGVMKVMDTLGVDEAINYLNNTIVPNLQKTFGEEGAREIGSSVMMALPFVRKVPSMKAFHGSPHDFDEFSMDQIGTGEGAQAYGHGLYFAESEDVARGYRDQLKANVVIRNDGIKMTYGDHVTEIETAIKEKFPRLHPDNVRSTARSVVNDNLVPDDVQGMGAFDKTGYLAEDIYLEGIRANKGAQASKGSMYQVEIDASPDEFLDWDLPLSEQSDLVRKNMETLGFTDNKKAVNDFDNALLDNLFNDSSKPLPKQPSDLRGEHLYYQSAPKATNPAEASKALSGLGIKGIRYKDGFSRGADGGTSNYVIFDDRLISIAKKYGIAIPAAAALLSQETGLNPISLYEEENPV